MSRQDDLNNHADQLNPNNEAYWESRGDERPDDWEEKSEQEVQKGGDHPSKS
jgi:hypothetical protein